MRQASGGEDKGGGGGGGKEEGGLGNICIDATKICQNMKKLKSLQKFGLLSVGILIGYVNLEKT